MEGDNVSKIEIDVHDGGQVNIAKDNAVINAVQNNEIEPVTKDKKFQKDKKQKYIENWNSRMFLHVDNDENPITLKDAFIVPRFDYYIGERKNKFSDKYSLTEAIGKFIQYNKTSNLLITGSPGIGKTSIVSWIADKYKDDEDIIILRFRDWSNNDLAEGLFDAICNSLNCKKEDLENKVLIKDGFDEIKSVNNRKSLMREFFNNTLDLDNLKVIITSRPDYLDTYDFQDVINVLPFDVSQIKQFCQIMNYTKLDQEKIDSESLDVLGIPVILYMAIMTDIDLTLKTTKPELYNRIFAEKGGIFDRFCFKRSGYDSGYQPLRDKENVSKYLGFLRQVAFTMFQKNDLSLTNKEYNIPELIFQGQKLKVVEFPIKPFFESSGNNIEFIHKSIYEYFVSEYIFRLLYAIVDNNMTEEELAGALGRNFIDNTLSLEILEYLRYSVKNSKLSEKAHFVKKVFHLMIRDGMTYHTNKLYKNVIKCEKKIFSNMLKILYIWEEDYCLQLDNNSILDFLYNNDSLETIILNSQHLNGVILKNVNLTKAQLCGARICDSILTGVNLCKANLERANIENTILCKAIFTGAVLRRAELNKVDLTGADLSNTDFQEAILDDFSLCGANLENSIWHIDDVRKIYPQLYRTKFTSIIITSTYSQKIVSRTDYLSKKDFNDFREWLLDELGL